MCARERSARVKTFRGGKAGAVGAAAAQARGGEDVALKVVSGILCVIFGVDCRSRNNPANECPGRTKWLLALLN